MYYKLKKIFILIRFPIGRKKVFDDFLFKLRHFLRPIAGCYRRFFLGDKRFVVIVGSFGKTTTTRAIKAVLLKTPDPSATRNTQITAILQIFRMHPKNKYAVFEAGIRMPGQMVKFAKMLRPQITVVTSIGSEHHTSLGTLENTRNEKVEMVRALPTSGVAILNADDPHVMWMKTQTQARVVTFGFNSDAEICAESVDMESLQQTKLCVRIGDQYLRLKIKLVSKVMIYPILAALAVTWAEGLDLLKITPFLEFLPPTPNRLQPVILGNGATMLCDEFKASIETVEVALDTFHSLPAKRHIAAIGMLDEIPDKFGPTYRWFGEHVAHTTDKVVFIGSRKAFKRICSGMKRVKASLDATIYPAKDINHAIKILHKLLRPGDLVLVKGRGSQKLHRIVLGLEDRTVKCTLKQCKTKITTCRSCPMLEKGWNNKISVL
jgi:UDP-N-acetylmuramoyl-tripeptide--D-alanyl-D-alanine ligase